MTQIPMISRDEASCRSASDSVVTLLDPSRLRRAKAAYTTRRVDFDRAVRLIGGGAAPNIGDLMLASVESIGQHSRIELATGRRAALHVGDEVVLCYGSRYAPDQFEACLPDDLGPCDMVAAGGIAARCLVRHDKMKRPTRVTPVGILADEDGRRINLARFALVRPSAAERKPEVFVVCGSSMNAGKTTLASQLVRSLKIHTTARIGACKVTGTGAGGDRWALVDAGADCVLDFTDCGLPSTFGVSAARIESLYHELIDHLAGAGAEAIVIEIADGIYQRETRLLLESGTLRNKCSGLFFAAADALSAVAGVAILQSLGHKVLAVGGAMTASPLAIREAGDAVEIPVVSSQDIESRCWLPTPEAGGDSDGANVGETAPMHGFVKWISAGPTSPLPA